MKGAHLLLLQGTASLFKNMRLSWPHLMMMGLEGGQGLSDEYLPPFKQREKFFPFIMVAPVANRPVVLPPLPVLREMIPCT